MTKVYKVLIQLADGCDTCPDGYKEIMVEADKIIELEDVISTDFENFEVLQVELFNGPLIKKP